ncbi:MAG: hypothetical protein LBS41_01930 [Streptococcaceae bacterium]|jgi:hypothetical protein|nr:hypothetical protein [Streptococcaceae bacterium]
MKGLIWGNGLISLILVIASLRNGSNRWQLMPHFLIISGAIIWSIGPFLLLHILVSWSMYLIAVVLRINDAIMNRAIKRMADKWSQDQEDNFLNKED